MLKVIVLSMLMSSGIQANVKTFMPENNLDIPVGVRSGISEEQFKTAIQKTLEFYRPFIKENYNKELEINGKWEDGTVNAWVKPTEDGYYIQMFGGLARHEETTVEGFYTVIFHEIGHAIGGAPKYARYGIPEWASCEGQSDYYATSKAAKIIFGLDEENTLDKYAQADNEFILNECNGVYSDSLNAAICYRSALGGLSLGKLLASLSNKEVDIKTPSQEVVSKTNVKGYPANQCRLDTYFQGALCDMPFENKPSMTDSKIGFCNKDSFEVGSRPACWFKE